MKLNDIFTDHMILQANKPVRVFGSGRGKVIVEILGEKVTTISDSDDWMVKLPAFDYGGPYEMIVNLDGNIKELKDIYFGDVYLLSGQSNNHFILSLTNTQKQYYKDNDSVRLFTIDRLEDRVQHVLTEDGWKTLEENGDIVPLYGDHYKSTDGWVKAEKDTVGFWPALGYLLGNELTTQSDKKIGLIGCYQGASCIQSWLPENFLDDTEFFVPKKLRSSDGQNPQYSEWNVDGILYKKKIQKLLPFSIKAVIWYQGESNSDGKDSNINVYAGMLKMLIEKWREDFRDSCLPFVIVQIHDYIYGLNKENSGWRDVQRAQEMVCEVVDDAYLVKSADISEIDNIHPASKLPLAQRIARIVETLS